MEKLLIQFHPIEKMRIIQFTGKKYAFAFFKNISWYKYDKKLVI